MGGSGSACLSGRSRLRLLTLRGEDGRGGSLQAPFQLGVLHCRGDRAPAGLSGRAVCVPSGVESSRDWPRGRLSKAHVSEESR